MRCPRSKSKDEGKEIGLFAGGFKGRCHNCGKFGHKAVDCTEPKKIDGRKGQGDEFYRYCRSKDHTIENCPKVTKKELRLDRERKRREHIMLEMKMTVMRV